MASKGQAAAYQFGGILKMGYSFELLQGAFFCQWGITQHFALCGVHAG
jgi:hypothetical protein